MSEPFDPATSEPAPPARPDAPTRPMAPTPPPGFGAPTPPPQPPYQAPQPPYQPPYQAPQPPYQPPYQAPQPPYQAPQPPYQAPQQAAYQPPQQAFQPPQQAYQPPSQPPPGAPFGGAGQPASAQPSGGRNVLWLVLGAIVGLAAVGGAAVFALSGGDDGDGDAVDRTTTTVSDTAPSTTAADSAGTGATVDEAVTTDAVATSVVQIYAASGGVPICQGSGSIVTADGLIVTNAHVVENSEGCAWDSLQVAITGSSDAAPEVKYLAEVFAYDASLDLAVIGITTDLDGNPVTVTDLRPVAIGDSDLVGLGDQIRILGYPALGGDTITFTSGSVSGFTSEAGISDRAWIKTDATISGGNSGGLAVNDRFEMIGVPTQASGGADLDIADCRVVADTNGDGAVDGLDSCIPIGGFINGIRPSNLAAPLIVQAAARIPVDTAPPSVVTGVGDTSFLGITMTSGIEADLAVDVVSQLPAAAPQVCATFDYEGMADGMLWDALWSIDGEFIPEISMVESEWVGGPSGQDWWVCATGDEFGLPSGMYELALYAQGEFKSSNTVHIGAPGPFTVTFVNNTSFEICFLQVAPSLANGWGPDDLGATQTVPVGASVQLSIPGDTYDVLGQDCDLTRAAEIYGVAATEGATISVVEG
jgi:S1-C subfamily serine protease